MANLADEQNQAELAERYSVENLATLNGYCQMRHDIEPIEGDYLEFRLRRYLTFAEFKSQLAPHFWSWIRRFMRPGHRLSVNILIW